MTLMEPASLLPTVLIVDDDPHIRQLLTFAFGKAGMTTIEAGDGEAALALATARQPALVVLDINMPRMDGLEVCRRLRAEGEVPVLFLSSRDEEIDRILGIELGADDYVVKPFSPREVVARAKAILRRTGSAPASSPEPAGDMHYGDLSIDVAGWCARWRSSEVVLTATEFGLLRALASAPGRFFSRDQLIDRLHGPGFAITDRTIDSHVRNLRRKFTGAGCLDLVETRAGVGYRLGPCRGSPQA
ncbi:response regulator receiver domain protein [Novosphingobium sp. Rr 2-17]|uniref:response regulator transcription factor n=1 Tax=Novosphingobium sp. Rr 2-17 TaxID=555793 RepID=UPI0002697B19|nr:response regulator transcription factor [Novosphingobium sp. Rr 2-17]EIZ80194.1 response regulator receiver domain protein [Novosphingobium sp. Rr 2-17]